MAYMRYLDALDSLLEAGDSGETLQAGQPTHSMLTDIIARYKPALLRFEVALPPVVLAGYCHVAELDLAAQRIYYKRVLSHQEAQSSTGLACVQEAQDHALSHWPGELHHERPERCVIIQTRNADNTVTWKVSASMAQEAGAKLTPIKPITRQAQFMEMARIASVFYA